MFSKYLFDLTLYWLPFSCFYRYFKPSPRFHIDEESETCTLYLPKSCPLQSVRVQQNIKILKQFACLEACKQLHQIGALTDNLVPDMVVEEAGALKLGNLYILISFLFYSIYLNFPDLVIIGESVLFFALN